MKEAKTTQEGVKTGSTQRQIKFPNSVYCDMIDENNILKKEGSPENTEETIINLVADGIKYRKQLRSEKAQ